MVNMLRPLLERFWVWLGGELPVPDTGLPIEPGPDQFIYIVRAGDTLRSIARRFSTSVWILADLNDLDDPRLIRVGQRLLIPQRGVPPPAPLPAVPGPEQLVEAEVGPFIYIVQTGDTLTTIAHRFGVPVATVVETNRIHDPNLVRPGQRLLIPGPQSQPEPEPSPPEPEPTTLPLPRPEPVPQPELEQLPSPYIYEVQPNDTLMAIARRFNVTVRAIIEVNELEDPNLIRPGQRLTIPGISLPSVPAPTHERRPSRSEPAAALPSLSPIPWPDDAIRAIYVSYLAIGHEARRRHVIELLTKTEINALVIDVKGDQGFVSYPTSVALAHDIGAARPTAHDFDELMDFFTANGIYTIARIVTFKDHAFGSAHPEWAVRWEGGGVWHDRDELAWADPFAEAAWEYNVDLAEEAAHRGFDEIQFDYVRFPTHSQAGTPRYLQPPSRETRVAAIAGFLSYARGRLAPLGVGIAANVFGYACWRRDDSLIGQDVEYMAQYLDVLCPMLFPSMFGGGIPGYKYAIAYPYEIVYESMKQTLGRVESLGCRVRPWIQDFPDHRFDKRSYGPAEIRAQMRGSFEGGGTGYMAWDPRGKYTTGAYLQNAIDMSLPDDYN